MTVEFLAASGLGAGPDRPVDPRAANQAPAEATPPDSPIPRPPTQVEGLGVPIGLVEDLFMRRLLTLKRSTTTQMATDLAVTMSVVQELSDDLRDKGYLEYLGLDGREYRFGLTDSGQQTTLDRMKISMYSGHAPVSLADYRRVVERQHHLTPAIDRAAIESAYTDLVLEDVLVNKVGASFLNEGAIFLYGPPGTGKTSLAERMGGIYHDAILVPRCIEADGQIVMLYDPAVHDAVPAQPPGLDPRWVLCRRPLVLVGGEMTLHMLDLAFEGVSGVYSPPVQLLANNGILVVDDFGRQAMTPDEILNRWIVPLSRDVDFLKLNNGAKFTVPFALKLVISTNLDPNELGDDAFLRRLRNKVFIGPCTETAFEIILHRAANEFDIEVMAGAADHLRMVAMRFQGELRPHIAVDFCDLMRGICEFEHLPRQLDPAMIDRVADIYFVEDGVYDRRSSQPT